MCWHVHTCTLLNLVMGVLILQKDLMQTSPTPRSNHIDRSTPQLTIALSSSHERAAEAAAKLSSVLLAQSESERTVNELRGAVTSAEAAAALSASMLTQAVQQRDELQRDMEALRVQHAEQLRTEAVQREADRAAAESRITELSEQRDSLLAELKQGKAELSTLEDTRQEDSDALNEEVATLQCLLVQAQTEVSELRLKLAHALLKEDDLNQAQEEISALQCMLAQTQDKVSQLQTQLLDTQIQAETSQSGLSDNRRKIDWIISMHRIELDSNTVLLRTYCQFLNPIPSRPSSQALLLPSGLKLKPHRHTSGSSWSASSSNWRPSSSSSLPSGPTCSRRRALRNP